MEGRNPLDPDVIWAAGRDALERDFTEQVAAPFNIDFRLTEACMAPMQATLTI